MFQSDLLIWWFVRIWEYPMLQIFYSWDLIKTTLTPATQPFIHLCILYLPSAPERSSPVLHQHSRSAVSGQQSSEQTGRQFLCSLFGPFICSRFMKNTMSSMQKAVQYMDKSNEFYCYCIYCSDMQRHHCVETQVQTFSLNARGFTNCVPSSIFRGSN